MTPVDIPARDVRTGDRLPGGRTVTAVEVGERATRITSEHPVSGPETRVVPHEHPEPDACVQVVVR